jgi:hypothetical protein
VRRAHPPSHISLDGLAVTTHWSCPQAPGCTNERGDNFPETGGPRLLLKLIFIIKFMEVCGLNSLIEKP